MNTLLLLAALAAAAPGDGVVKLREETVETVSPADAAGRCRDTRGRFVKCPEKLTAYEKAEVEDEPPAVDVTITGGTVVAFGDADSAAGLKPFVNVAVSFPLSKWAMTPRANVAAELTGQPGQGVGLEDPETFTALAGRIQLEQTVHPKVYIAPFCEAGFVAYRAESGTSGLGHWGCGLAAGGMAARGYLYGWFGQSARLTPGIWRLVGGGRGSVKLWESDQKDGILKDKTMRLNIEVEYGLRKPLDATGQPQRSMVATAAIAVGL